MSLKDDLARADKAHDKLVTYCAGLPKGSNNTVMYDRLNAEADKAIKKLPVRYRSRFALDMYRFLK